MRRLAVASWLVVVATSSGSHAQMNARTLTLAGVGDCLTEAIATNSVVDDGSVIVFSCNAAKAKTLYNFLSKKIAAEVVYDRNGKFEDRPFGNSACYHRVEDQSGKTADEFRCDLVVAIGNILGDEVGSERRWWIESMKPIIRAGWSFRGATEGGEPGIHIPRPIAMVPGSPHPISGLPEIGTSATADVRWRPGMTRPMIRTSKSLLQRPPGTKDMIILRTSGDTTHH